MTGLSENLRHGALEASQWGGHLEASLMRQAADRIDQLERILDGRPAINAALPQSYIDWSQGIYMTEALDVLGGRQ